MLLALEPHRFESVQQAWNSLPSGAMQELRLDLRFSHADDDCRNPSSDEALLATATELAHMMSGIATLKSLQLNNNNDAFIQLFLEACPRLTSLSVWGCTLEASTVQSIFSIKKLTKLMIQSLAFSNDESFRAFSCGMETGSLKSLYMIGVSFRNPDHQEQLATTLARCKTLVRFKYPTASRIFSSHYCAALSNNVDTKLVLLLLMGKRIQIVLHGCLGEASGIDTATVVKIRNLLTWNMQRKKCPPLFAAIGDAETDTKRKQCLVEAFEAVDVPVVFEYIIANENNLIEMIQRLGRSRKRQRED